jgi:RecA/RadA recombinase
MIIELFGPPASGKTTFARNLAAHLKGRGRTVELILSFRPAETIERDGIGRPAAQPLAAMRRLTRPAIEYLACMGHMSVGSSRTSIASELLALLPPASPVSLVRLHQYITRLENSWRLVEQSDAIVIIDQGFVQAVCSLVLHVRTPSASAIQQALALIPKADHWIRIDAPRHLLRARLEARRRGQSWIERRFELDTETSLRSIEVLNMLDPILRQHAPRIAHLGIDESWPPRESRGIIELCSAMTQANSLGMRAR